MIEKVTLEMNGKQELVLEGTMKCHELNPKAHLLYAAAQCAGLTVLHILKKEQLTPKSFEISVSGELSTDTVQAGSIFRSFNVVYNVDCGRYEDQIKTSRAVNLAHEKYCGLMQMLRKVAPVTHEVAIVSTQPAEA